MGIQRRRSRTHHFFLFRHCVRSTSNSIPLDQDNLVYNNEHDDESHQSLMSKISTMTNYSINPADYIGSDLPNWQVPEEWCLPGALAQVQNVGQWLLEEGFLQDAGPRIHFEFLTDTVHRDVDTAFALAQGLAQAVQKRQNNSTQELSVVHGLSNLHYVQWLFQPLKADPMQLSTSNNNNTALCQESYSQSEQAQFIQEHLATIPRPSSFRQASELLMQKGGIGAAGNWTHLFPAMDSNDTNLVVMLPSDLKHVGGVAHLIKLYAQMAFYSRAGNVTPPFLPTLTTEEVYTLLQWVYWNRMITSAYTPRQATMGSVMAQVLLHALEHGSLYDTPDRSKSRTRMSHAVHHDDPDDTTSTKKGEEYDTYVIIVTGHDGNLEDLVTALGASYIAPPPYRHPVGGTINRNQNDTTSSGSNRAEPYYYLATPPMSGIYARQDVHDDRPTITALNFVTPIYSQQPMEQVWTAALNDTGILEQVPLLERGSDNHLFDTVLDNYNDDDDHLDQLRQHIEQVLQQYTGSLDCFQTTKHFIDTLSHGTRSPFTTTSSRSKNDFSILLNHKSWRTIGVLVTFVIMVTALAWFIFSRRRQDSGEPTASTPAATTIATSSRRNYVGLKNNDQQSDDRLQDRELV
jgi:hypothetical protein